MIHAPRVILFTALVIALMSGSRAQAQKPIPKEEIYKKSDWDFVLDGGQKGGVRIRQGEVYPGNKKLTNQVGSFTFEGDAMEFEFVNHPLISNSTAKLVKVGEGKWEGVVVGDLGQERRIVMTRR
jgi:hypothetical protein